MAAHTKVHWHFKRFGYSYQKYAGVGYCNKNGAILETNQHQLFEPCENVLLGISSKTCYFILNRVIFFSKPAE